MLHQLSHTISVSGCLNLVDFHLFMFLLAGRSGFVAGLSDLVTYGLLCSSVPVLILMLDYH